MRKPNGPIVYTVETGADVWSWTLIADLAIAVSVLAVLTWT